MASCYDCLHEKVCEYFLIPPKAEKCVDFKDKTQYAKVVHGRWIGGYIGNSYTVPKCSLCGYGNGAVGATNYCPNCGAKMDGERKDNG